MGILNEDLITLKQRWFGDVDVLAPGWLWGDHFNRNTINLTGFTLWAVAGTIARTTAAQNYPLHGMRFTTGAVIGNDVVAFSQEHGFGIGKNGITQMDMIITAQLVQTADTELQIGFLHSNTAPGVLTTTVKHALWELDLSTSPNWRTTTADGTAQDVVTSSTVANTSSHDFEIILRSSSVQFLLDGTSIRTATTNLPSSGDGLNIYLFIQTEAAATKAIDFDKVQIQYS